MTLPEPDPFAIPPGTTCETGSAPGSWRLQRLPASIYHGELTRLSCSMLKQMLVSPAHYLRGIVRQHRPSPAMEFGTLLHLLILEPQLLPAQYVVIPGGNRASPEEKRAAQALHPGRHVLTEVQLHEARIAADKVMARPVRGRPFHRYVEEGLREVTLYFQDPVTGLPCRSRLDLWHPDALFDLKTTRHATADAFARAAVDLHYDLQAYMYAYADAVFGGRDAARDFVFIAIQSEEPHPVHVLTAGETFMRNGRAKFERALSLARACSNCDFWPDGGTDTILEIEPWQSFRPGDLSGQPQTHALQGEDA